MGFPPEVFLIGAQKSGTSTLASLLDTHPEITVSNPKETHFFTVNYKKGIKWYEQTFNSKKNILVDASTSYAMARLDKQNASSGTDSVPARVYSLNPSAKFIYILRNPTDRTYSGYWHGVRTGRIDESFGELIRSKNFNHLDTSNYNEQLLLWLKYFPLESFLILKFEDLIEKPDETLKRCFNFIGVNSHFKTKSNQHDNKSYVATRFGRKYNNLLIKYPILKRVVRYTPGVIKPIARKLVKKTNIPKMGIKDREYLNNYFYEKNKKLSELTGIDFNSWNK
ncbi:sulfotransferase domain-containing protein [Bacillus piscicola]|uniref:sulfotransferase domain-containing protein n=1 Tax=Bacillus piscicola TaxID=1632684 RepID=UPI001F09124A|nr:sulfotransferase domain-containing protein [Bacillus piscicola]